MTLFALLLAITNPLAAMDPRLPVGRYLHNVWTQEEGVALPPIIELAQTTDGYLWLGTGTGLMRFDGMRFVAWEPPSGEKLPEGDVRSLLASADGGLWVRTTRTISRIYQGHIARYPAVDQWLGGKNRAIAEDHDGRLWLVRMSKPPEVGSLLPNGTFHVYGTADGLPPGTIRSIFEDRHLDLWMITEHDLCRWAPGHPAECSAFPLTDLLALAGEKAADFLVSDGSGKSPLQSAADGLKSVASRTGGATPLPKSLMADHDGVIWIGTVGQGLMRVAEGKLERYQRANGLSNDAIRSVLEDRERNLWVATAKGLERFRDPQVLRVSTAEGLSSDFVTAIHAGHAAEWVGTMGGGLNRVAGTQVTRYEKNSGLPSTNIISLFEDRNGLLWVGTTAGFGSFSNNRFAEVRTPEGKPLSRIFAIAADGENRIWLAGGTMGLFVVRDGVAWPVTRPGVPAADAYQLHVDRDGAAWIGFHEGGVAVIRGDAVQHFTPSDGLAPGSIQAFARDHTGVMWVGAAAGLSRLRDGVWTTWEEKQGVPKGGISGILEDDHETLWFMTSQGLSSIKLAELNRSPDGSPRNLEFQLYGQGDGVRLTPTAVMAGSRTAKAGDGRLWICTEDGVAIVDPMRIRHNPLPPPVVIEEIVVDGKALDIRPGFEMPFRGHQVHITYTGLSLTVPERVRFRYRLEGLEHDWTDAGGRRNVDYVNLPPRSYRFHVIACNNEGTWNNTGATLAFRIDPYFYETRWFYALCAVVVGLLAWSVHLMRVRMVVTRYRAITQERARLTRELHDSLLQGFVAVVYQLEAAARQFENEPEQGRQRLGRAIEQADRAVGDARRTMMAMRIPEIENSTLPEALRDVAARLIDGTEIDFHLDVKGMVRHLPYDAQANVFLIGREAITNAVNHAHPSRVVAALLYSAKQVRLVVEDDGKGFDVKAALAKQGHWGMAGMHERADQIGATLSVSSAPGEATKVELVVPHKA